MCYHRLRTHVGFSRQQTGTERRSQSCGTSPPSLLGGTTILHYIDT